MWPNELKDALKHDGWNIERYGYEWKRTGVEWWAWKQHEDFLDCTSNEKPPHVALIPWSHPGDNPLRSVQITVTGEVRDRWVEFQVYSVTMDEAMNALPRAVNILRAAWNAAAQE